ncbi:MAG TPA: erythromycin esterase family protein, partial [Thermoanaerobaculia bacterium]
YRFWAVDEMLAVVEWMRTYNATRGDRPALQIAGADVYDGVGAAQEVLRYLRAVDPLAAAEAEAEYSCVSSLPSPACRDHARIVLDRLTAKRAEYESIAGAPAFVEARQSATVVMQANATFGERDGNMATNVEWLLANRSAARRIIFWAHQEHVGKTQTPFVGGLPSGAYLDERLGSRYVAIGSMTGGGSYRYWRSNPFGEPATAIVPPPASGTYESFFRLREAAALLIPLNGEAVPAWLAGPAHHFVVGTSASDQLTLVSLPAKLDAVVYIEFSSPTQPLTR